MITEFSFTLNVKSIENSIWSHDSWISYIGYDRYL